MFTLICPIPIQYHRAHSSFLHFCICNSLLQQWEPCLSLSLISMWTILLYATSLQSLLPHPPLSRCPPLPARAPDSSFLSVPPCGCFVFTLPGLWLLVLGWALCSFFPHPAQALATPGWILTQGCPPLPAWALTLHSRLPLSWIPSSLYSGSDGLTLLGVWHPMPDQPFLHLLESTTPDGATTAFSDTPFDAFLAVLYLMALLFSY